MPSVTTCSNKHEKPIPAVGSHPVDGKERLFCQACSEVWKQRQRDARRLCWLPDCGCDGMSHP